jgi:protein phosphatase
MSTVLRLAISGKTDVGRLREHNEDNIAWDADLGLALLADGMGGHNAGEVASALAVDTILGVLRTALPATENLVERSALLRDAVEDANRAIFTQSQEQPQCAGMGTTLVGALFSNDNVILAHVGDSRIYRLRDTELAQITTDHSLLEELVQSGYLTKEEAELSVNKNLITRALGIEADVDADIDEHGVMADDIYLLCSDGLSDLVSDHDIAAILNDRNRDLETAAASLVFAANAKGGTDNISVILVHVLPFDEHAHED